MKKLNQLRRMAPVVVVVALLIVSLAACTSNKKYGCPNHLNSGISAR